MARKPRVPLETVDLKQLKELMRLKPTLTDTASFFDVCERQIERIIRREWNLTFVEFRQIHMAPTRLALQRKAIQMAQSGNTAMMIFCLKTICGWEDPRNPERDVTPDADQNNVVVYETQWGSNIETPDPEPQPQ